MFILLVCAKVVLFVFPLKLQFIQVTAFALICLLVVRFASGDNEQDRQERKDNNSSDASDPRFLWPFTSMDDNPVPYNNGYDYTPTYRPYPINYPNRYPPANYPGYVRTTTLPPLPLPPSIVRVVVTVPPAKNDDFFNNGIPPRPAPPVRVNVKIPTTPKPEDSNNW